MADIARHTRRRLFDEWVHDQDLRQRLTFLEYVERLKDERGPPDEPEDDEPTYAEVERQALQDGL